MDTISVSELNDDILSREGLASPQLLRFSQSDNASVTSRHSVLSDRLDEHERQLQSIKREISGSKTHTIGMKNSIDRLVNFFSARSPVNVQNDRSLSRIFQLNLDMNSNRTTPFPSLPEQSNSAFQALHKDVHAQSNRLISTHINRPKMGRISLKPIHQNGLLTLRGFAEEPVHNTIIRNPQAQDVRPKRITSRRAPGLARPQPVNPQMSTQEKADFLDGVPSPSIQSYAAPQFCEPLPRVDRAHLASVLPQAPLVQPCEPTHQKRFQPEKCDGKRFWPNI